jgi:hypothetical protein
MSRDANSRVQGSGRVVGSLRAMEECRISKIRRPGVSFYVSVQQGLIYGTRDHFMQQRSSLSAQYCEISTWAADDDVRRTMKLLAHAKAK